MKKKVSDETLKRLNEIEPSALVAANLVERVAKDKLEIICPECRNGTGSDKTGIAPYKASDGHIGYHCTKCDARFNNIKMIRKAQGVSFVEACELIANAAGVNLEYDTAEGDGEYHARKRSAEVKEQLRVIPESEGANDTSNSPAQDKLQSVVDEVNTDKAAELELIRKDLTDKANIEDLEDFCKKHGGSWRGLPLEILKKHGCVLSSFWAAPSRLLTKGAQIKTSKRVLIPNETLTGYLARAKDANSAMPKIHVGKKCLFRSDKNVLEGNSPVFVTEGAIDCMSIEFAGFNAVALGGIGGGSLLTNYLKENALRPKIILLFDGDKSGRDAAPKLLSELKKINVPCVMKFLRREGESEKIDCNSILVDNGRDVLQQRLQEIFDNALPEFELLGEEKSAQADAANVTRKTQSAVGSEGVEDTNEERRQKLLQLLESKEPKNEFDIFKLYAGGFEDLDFARRLEKFSGRYIRWLNDEETWLAYNSGEGVWRKSKRDSNSAIFKFGRRLADFCDENAGDSKFKQKVATTLKKSKTITGALKYLCSVDSVQISSKDLDAHSELLNCSNCVVDLVTGKSYRQRPELLLTRKTAAAFYPNIDTAQVEKFFADVMPDEPTRRGLLRWLGYCVSGETNADKFSIFTGESGKNGKSTLTSMLIECLDEDFAATMNANAIALQRKQKNGDGATAGLNVVEGRRMVMVEEISSNLMLDSAVVKNLSGGDRLALRRLFGEYRVIRPSAKLIIVGNFMPRLESVIDGGLLRRLLNFDFNVKFGTPEHPADEGLKKRLLQPRNLSALLKILITEARQWYRDGLIISDQMQASRDRHLQENDFCRSFIAENGIVTAEGESISAKTLLEELKDECPGECSRFKRSDLIKMIETVTGAKYTTTKGHAAKFVGIKKS